MQEIFEKYVRKDLKKWVKHKTTDKIRAKRNVGWGRYIYPLFIWKKVGDNTIYAILGNMEKRKVLQNHMRKEVKGKKCHGISSMDPQQALWLGI